MHAEGRARGISRQGAEAGSTEIAVVASNTDPLAHYLPCSEDVTLPNKAGSWEAEARTARVFKEENTAFCGSFVGS
jgi:hypothetical protein